MVTEGASELASEGAALTFDAAAMLGSLCGALIIGLVGFLAELGANLVWQELEQERSDPG